VSKVKLVVHFVSGGMMPGFIPWILGIRADVIASDENASAEDKEKARELSKRVRGGEDVARFEREIDLPIPVYPGLELANVGPRIFMPDQMRYDAETGVYELIENGSVCPETHGCGCHAAIRDYMSDDRWALMSAALVEEEADG